MSSELKNQKKNDINETPPPTWLNAEFLTKILNPKENTTDDFELLTFQVTTTSNKHEHYGSLMFRATVNYRQQNEHKQQSLIIKAMVEQESAQKDLLKGSTIFETEINIYSKVIPKFEGMLREAGDHTKLVPRLLYYALKPTQILVFEDLAPLGYTVLSDRATNFEETKMVYTKIAKWHAIGYKLNLEHADFFKPFHHNLFETIGLRNMATFHDGIYNFIELLESQADLAHYKPYFEPYCGKALDYWEKSAAEFLQDHQSTAYYALVHGDFHHKNMMFKRNVENDRLEDVLLIDFQLCYMGPIVNDIIASTFLIMDTEQRLHNLDELIYFYFENFKSTLQQIGFHGTMPKMQELRKQIMRHKGFEIFLFTTIWPLLMATDERLFDIGQLMGDAEIRKAMYKNPKYVELVRQLLPKYLYMGYLEKDEVL